MSISSNHITLFSPTLYLTSNSRLQNPVVSFTKPRKRNLFVSAKSRKLIIDSVCIIASKIGFLPHPFDLILRNQFGSGSGSGSGSGNGFGFGWSDGFFDGGKRRKRMKFGMWVLACGLFWCLVLGKELGMDALLGGLGLVLFGVSVDVLKKGAKDWVLGFVCCGFLIGLVFKREELRSWVKCVVGSMDVMKSGRRRRKLRMF